MRVLVTGHLGYIGAVLVPRLVEARLDVVGLDAGIFRECAYTSNVPRIPTIAKDIRDITSDDLAGVTAIVHLAGVSFGGDELSARLAYEINYRGTVQLASLAKFAGVRQFISVSNFDGVFDEERVRNADDLFRRNPQEIERYVAQSVETDLKKLASSVFAPTFLRCNSVYGFSPMLRLDLPLNHIAASAVLTNEAYIPADGEWFHPGTHVQDVATAILVLLGTSPQTINSRAFNVRDIGGAISCEAVTEILKEVVPDCQVYLIERGGAEAKPPQVLNDEAPFFQPRWSVREGLMQLFEAFITHPLPMEEVMAGRYQRQEYVYFLMKEGRVDASLRWFDANRPAFPTLPPLDLRRGQTTQLLNF